MSLSILSLSIERSTKQCLLMKQVRLAFESKERFTNAYQWNIVNVSSEITSNQKLIAINDDWTQATLTKYTNKTAKITDSSRRRVATLEKPTQLSSQSQLNFGLCPKFAQADTKRRLVVLFRLLFAILFLRHILDL